MKENEKAQKMEAIEKKLEKIMWIKKIVYGFGIPPKGAPVWKDLSQLRKEYAILSKSL